ncbi:MAG TPA: DUF362 domain-containing protein [Candidatus Hydrogenedentes bacterium]|nr:DUF362 domain-containing protein [Candidatus Hydrogenedentota bacterium]HOK88795.1 DUF362 domain-containing protein [Candidatus Hydrogenedentota bacterium]
MFTNRREFLKTTAALGGAAMLPYSLAMGADAPLMAIARWKGDENAPMMEVAEKLTVEAIRAIGGLEPFIKKGGTVWVKPNIGWDRTPEQAANTHPGVVKALVRLCYEAGAGKVKVGDNPCNDIRKSYQNSGIEAAAKEAGAEVVYLDRNRFREMEIGGKRLTSIPIYPDIFESDLVISVPVAKHHSSTRVTLCMKNYMGVVENRKKFHQDLPYCIADLTKFMKPRISVVDATRILMDHGPTGGDLNDVKITRTVAAGTDIVALDAFGAELLGNKPELIGTIRVGAEYGLGVIDYKSLNPKEVTAA